MSTACHFHPYLPGTHQCAVRRQPMCGRCANAFTVGQNSSPFSGQPICPDCLKEMVRDNAAALKKNTATIKRDFIISLVGIVIGAILGFCVGITDGVGAALIMALIFAGIGGMFLSFVKFYFSLLWEGIKAIFSCDGVVGVVISVFLLIFNLIIGALKCLYYTVKNTWEYISYLRETDDILKTDAEAVQMVDAYLAYTDAMDSNTGMDLSDMMAEGGPLHGNVYAEAVAALGEADAIEHLRTHVTLVALSFELVHDFGK